MSVPVLSFSRIQLESIFTFPYFECNTNNSQLKDAPEVLAERVPVARRLQAVDPSAPVLPVIRAILWPTVIAAAAWITANAETRRSVGTGTASTRAPERAEWTPIVRFETTYPLAVAPVVIVETRSHPAVKWTQVRGCDSSEFCWMSRPETCKVTRRRINATSI